MATPSEPGVRPGIRVLAAIFAVLALLLCRWQIRRDGERNEGREQAMVVAGQPALGDADRAEPGSAWRVVRWSGRFDAPAHLLAGTQHAGQRGYDVYQAFVRPDGERVLVDRGWIPADAADATVAAALSVDQPTLTGQLRPAPPDDGAVPVEGHGTRIWAPGGQGGIAAAVGAARGVYVVSGNPDGSPTGPGPITDGFVPVPARDNTSAHYASQWAAVALIGLLFAFPGPLLRLRRKMGA